MLPVFCLRASSGVTSGGGTCLSWGRFGGGCWALLKAELFLPFLGSSEASSAHPSFIPGPWGEALVTFSPSKSPPRCVCGIQGCPRGQPDLEEVKVLQDKPWGHWCCQSPLLPLCFILPKLEGQVSLLPSDKTHPGGSECMTFPESRGGLGPFCFLGHFILKCCGLPCKGSSCPVNIVIQSSSLPSN